MINKDTQSCVLWKERNGVHFLDVCFDGLDDSGIMSLTLEISRLMQEEGEGKVRLVTDLSGMGKDTNSYSSGRKFAKSHQKYIYKSAVTGLPHWLIPIYNVFVKFTKTKSKLFRSKEEAIDYICS